MRSLQSFQPPLTSSSYVMIMLRWLVVLLAIVSGANAFCGLHPCDTGIGGHPGSLCEFTVASHDSSHKAAFRGKFDVASHVSCSATESVSITMLDTPWMRFMSGQQRTPLVLMGDSASSSDRSRAINQAVLNSEVAMQAIDNEEENRSKRVKVITFKEANSLLSKWGIGKKGKKIAAMQSLDDVRQRRIEEFCHWF